MTSHNSASHPKSFKLADNQLNFIDDDHFSYVLTLKQLCRAIGPLLAALLLVGSTFDPNIYEIQYMRDANNG